jgi:hypothetical protein
VANNQHPDLEPILNDIRTLADQVRLQVHLASLEANTAWREEIEPRVKDLEARVVEGSDQAKDAVAGLAADLKASLTKFASRISS